MVPSTPARRWPRPAGSGSPSMARTSARIHPVMRSMARSKAARSSWSSPSAIADGERP
ncbi:MAG: hypothetical protein IPF99_12950 [Deltaproteobacteria bacterium]|nr:hypothetical protein [Deltaproteobacteria bacterium]